MSEWKECKLGEVIYSNGSSITASYSHKTIKYLDTGSITCGKIDSFQEILLSEAPSRAKRLVKDGSIVYSTVRPIQRHYGYIKNPPENLVVSTGFSVIETQPDLADSLFIYHLLASKDVVELLDTIAEGSTSAYPSLKPTDIENLDILLPPLPEQRAIASVLSSLDDKIDLLHRQNKTLEAMAETLFRQWFVEEADEGIRTIVLGDIIEIYDSKRIPLSSTERDKMKNGSLYPYYGAATIMDYINDYIFDGEYLLLGEDGTVQTDEGYPVLQLAVGKYWVNNHTHVLKAKKPYSNFLLYSILKKTSVSHIVTGAVQPKINQGNLKSLELNAPCDKMIQETVLQTNNYWQKIKLNNTQIRTLEKLRDTLLPKLMSGEVRVKI